MKNKKSLRFGLLATVGVFGVSFATLNFASFANGRAPAQTAQGTSHIAAVRDVLYAQSYSLETPYTHWYRAEQPEVSNGTILVLDVDPALVTARESFEQVLYVGAQTAERVNRGDTSGRLVVLVPGTDLDLSTSEVWFGSPELPERVDAVTVETERGLARAAGIEPFKAARIGAARLQGGADLEFSDRDALNLHLVEIVERFSPSEHDLIRGMRAERLYR